MRFDIRPAALPAVTGLQITAGIRANQLAWNAYGHKVAIYGSMTNNLGTATKVGETESNVFVHLLFGSGTWYYWLRGIDDQNREVGAWFPNTPTAGAVGVSALVQQLDIAARAVDAAKTNIAGINPATGAITADTVSANWVYAGNVAAANISAGTLGAGVAYVGNLSATNITSGTLTSCNININNGAFQINMSGYPQMTGAVISVATFGNLWNPSVAAITVSSSSSAPAIQCNGNMTVTGTINGSVSNANYASSAGSAGTASSAGYAGSVSNGSGAWLICGSYQAGMQTDGNFVAYGVGTWSAGTNTSDRRLKKNIKRTGVRGLDVIDRLEVVDFYWRKNRLPGKWTGFLADQVEKIIPQSVSVANVPGGKKDTLFLHKEEIVPYLVKAVQELRRELEELKGRGNVGK